MRFGPSVLGGFLLALGVALLILGLIWANDATEQTDGDRTDLSMLYSGLGLAAVGLFLGAVGLLILFKEYQLDIRLLEKKRLKKCKKCGEASPVEAEYCMMCSKKF